MKTINSSTLTAALLLLGGVAGLCHADPYPSDGAVPVIKPSEAVIASPKAPSAEPVSVFAPKLPSAPIGPLNVLMLDGKPLDLTSVSGYKVIYFFSIGCPCVRDCEQLTFKPLSALYQGKVAFYAVTSGSFDLNDDRKNFLALAGTHHLPFPIVLDTTHGVADKLGALTASQAILLDPENRVLFSGAADDSRAQRDETGKLGKTKSYLKDAVEQALAGKPVKVSYVRPIGCSIAK